MTLKSNFSLSILTVILVMPTFAFAEPDKPERKSKTSTELSEKIEDKLSEHKLNIAKSSARLKREFDKKQAAANGDTSKEIEAVADLLESVFANEGLFRDVTALVKDFADDVDVETNDGKTMLKFDGTTIGQIEKQKSRESDDKISISGLGKNITLDRETILKDGKSKTRIVIEMDGEDSVDITLPKLD